MSSSFVTQCPHCRTRFRVNHTQLSAANGAVRCGACMHVFDAARHLVADQPVVRIPPAPTSQPAPRTTTAPATDLATPPSGNEANATPPGKAIGDTLWIHDDLEIDDLDLDEELARLAEEEAPLSQEFLALQQAPKPADPVFNQASLTAEPHDEGWAEALLHENSSEAVVPDPARSATQEFDLHADPVIDEAFDRFDEPLDEPDIPPIGSTLIKPDAPDDDTSPHGSGQRRTEPRVQSSAPFLLADEPVQLDWRPKPRRHGRRWLWLLLNLLALAALAGQYAWRNFDELARQEQFRPWFAELCPVLGCQLPSKVDISQIRSSNLMVRVHPEFTGALIVDAILYNRAPFSQPFPLLEMRFTDLQGRPIASRRFKPSEYLAGELAGKSEMPSQTPIRIALEILDPGRHAESYSLNFLSPE